MNRRLITLVWAGVLAQATVAGPIVYDSVYREVFAFAARSDTAALGPWDASVEVWEGEPPVRAWAGQESYVDSSVIYVDASVDGPDDPHYPVDCGSSLQASFHVEAPYAVVLTGDWSKWLTYGTVEIVLEENEAAVFSAGGIGEGDFHHTLTLDPCNAYELRVRASCPLPCPTYYAPRCTFHLDPVPEPASFSLLALSCLLLRRR